MAGYEVAKSGHEVHFFDHKNAAGRKFLVAGHGGFNLTNNQELSRFLEEYTHDQIKQFVRSFSQADLRSWLSSLGIPTFVGTSERVFPEKGIKPIEVLQAILQELKRLGCQFHFGQTMVDFSDRSVTFRGKHGVESTVDGTFLVLALGGASWPQTGSTAKWVSLFEQKQIAIKPFLSSNAGMELREPIPDRAVGMPIKNAVFSLGSVFRVGEAVFTKYGLEGSSIYYLNRAYHADHVVDLRVDFKPTLTWDSFKRMVGQSNNRRALFRRAKLSDVAQIVIKERLTREDYLDDERLFGAIKSFPFTVNGLRPIEEVISVCGGVSWSELDSNGRLKQYPSVFLAGEMLDWDAPTGGYLLQGCFASGACVGREIVRLLVDAR